MEERAFHPLDYVSVLRRRMWWFVIPVAVCVVVGGLVALLWPRTYLSQAQIGVASPTLSPELLRGVQSLDKEERQRAISQQLLSRNVLERVVREEKIFPDKPVEETAGWLRSRVKIDVDKPLGGGENKNGLDSFMLGYMDATPEVTQRIANRLAYVFVEENSKTRTERAENTSEVLGQQLKASEERLTQIENQLRTKKEANMGRLPDQINANIQMANGLRQQLDSISVQLRGEQDRLSMIESQLEGMRQGSGTTPITSTAVASIQSAQQRINQLQQQLAQERALGKTDKHPDIVALNEEIANAKAELGAVRQTGGGANQNEMLNADPLYRQRIADRDTARLRIRTLQNAEAQARSQIAQYQSRIEAAPMVEQDLAAVNREAELERVRYADLKKQYDNARSAEDMARKQGGERFSVLYPAYLPTSPETPNRPKVLLMALALGLALGAGLVLAREFLDRSVHDARALQSEFEIPVLGEIPRIHGAL
ncbi:MAG TPA: Wzz/FepE/Etk N-terminal domain-containing protein [Vicinamibacterales bacterium]